MLPSDSGSSADPSVRFLISKYMGFANMDRNSTMMWDTARNLNKSKIMRIYLFIYMFKK